MALVAGHVMFGLSVICAALVALVASIVRQVRNEFGDAERYRWSWWVVATGTANIVLGLVVLLSSDDPARLAPGTVLIGLGLICCSILSKVLLLALVWRQTFALANRIPLIPVGTALACLFFAAFLFEATDAQPGFFVGARRPGGPRRGVLHPVLDRVDSGSGDVQGVAGAALGSSVSCGRRVDVDVREKAVAPPGSHESLPAVFTTLNRPGHAEALMCPGSCVDGNRIGNRRDRASVARCQD